ncbi:MAG: family 10 glycosylhydrolase [Lentisphaeria bacterium]|jgi:hypothetical protein|nr:family 10 glycosylhydrolase [Lentisphaeria bacterium]
MADAPRFIYELDGSFLHYAQPPISLERFLHETVGWLAGTQVDAVSCHMYSFGSAVPLYPTNIEAARAVYPDNVPTVNIWRAIGNMQAMEAAGVDHWALAVEAAHGRGLRFWAGMRFNDQHPAEYGLVDRFTTDHPEYRLGDRCAAPALDHQVEGADTGGCIHLDYSEPAVRAHRLALIEEVCTRYDVDGFDLDFNREGGHSVPRDKLAGGVQMLTAFVSQVRDRLIRIGERRGRPITFFVRVPGTPKACHDWQLEVERWMSDGLVDALAPSVMYDTTTELPFDEFVKMARGTACRVYACPTEGVGPALYRTPPTEALRAVALVAWQQGVDGIYLFNFHTSIMENLSRDLQVLGELGDPVLMKRRNKLYVVAGVALTYQGQYFGLEDYSAHPRQLPRDLPVGGEGVTVRFRVGDDLPAARRDRVLESVTLRLDFLYMTGEEVFDLKINGEPVPFERCRYRVSDQFDLNLAGMSGHVTAELDLTHHDCILQGINELRLVQTRRPGEVSQPAVFYVLRLDVRYHLVSLGVAST